MIIHGPVFLPLLTSEIVVHNKRQEIQKLKIDDDGRLEMKERESVRGSGMLKLLCDMQP